MNHTHIFGNIAVDFEENNWYSLWKYKIGKGICHTCMTIFPIIQCICKLTCVEFEWKAYDTTNCEHRYWILQQNSIMLTRELKIIDPYTVIGGFSGGVIILPIPKTKLTECFRAIGTCYCCNKNIDLVSELYITILHNREMKIPKKWLKNDNLYLLSHKHDKYN